MTSPSIVLGLCPRIKALAPDGRCKTFDARSDGYGRGEGCGVVLHLPPLRRARRRRPRPRGDPRRRDQPGRRERGLTVPSGPSQAAAIPRALADGGVDPTDLAYVEAHGTGTSLGDDRDACAARGLRRARAAPLYVGSVKSNIGHLEAGAGIAGLLKVVLALEHRVIPPSLHFVTPNPHIDWASIPVEVPTRCVPWPQGARAPVAGLSSFGLGGTNVHVVVEAAPSANATPKSAESAPPPLLESAPTLLLSARDDAALREAAQRTGQWLEAHPDAALAALCHVAATGRTHFAERLALPARDGAALRELLREAALGRAGAGAGARRGHRDEARPPETGFAFPAAAEVSATSGDELADWPQPFQDSVARCAAVLDPLLKVPLVALLGLDGSTPPQEPALRIPATLALELALAETWRAFGVAPDSVGGEGSASSLPRPTPASSRGRTLEASVALARRTDASGDIEMSRRIAAFRSRAACRIRRRPPGRRRRGDRDAAWWMRSCARQGGARRLRRHEFLPHTYGRRRPLRRRGAAQRETNH
jgi:acyl transferase domain-containing protein